MRPLALNPSYFVSPEKTYLVRRSDSGERQYQLHELTWLWRSAELPPDAVYLDARGEWRPVRELVEPVIEKERRFSVMREGEGREAKPPASTHYPPGGWWKTAAVVFLMAAVLIGSRLRDQYAAWRLAKAEERQALERERGTRVDDLIGSKDIVPGMTPEQVRRVLGPPRSLQATADASLERWIYRKQVVVFENGKVIGVEAPR